MAQQVKAQLSESTWGKRADTPKFSFWSPWHKHACAHVYTHSYENIHTHISSHTSTCTIICRNYKSYVFCDIWQANWKKISNPGILSCSRAFKWKETVYTAWGQVCIFDGRERDTYLMRWRSRKCKPALSWSQSEVWEQTENKSMWVE